MAGKCGCTPRGGSPHLDAADCNALTQTGAGLLVPRAVVEGVAPGTAVGTERSVDIDVTAPADGDCPATWTVGARLTPVWAQTSGVVGLDGSPPDTWVPLPGTDLTLPEAGVYQVTADLQASIASGGSFTNAIIDGRVFDVTAGTAVPLASRRVILITDQSAEAVLRGIQANASAGALYQVAGPTTLRVEGSKRVDAGTTGQTVLWAANFRYLKVSD